MVARHLMSLVLLLSSVAVLHSQPTELWLQGGVAINLHSASFTQLGSYASCCPEFSGGSGLGPWFGAGITLPLSPRWRFIGGLVYNAQHGTMTYDETSFVADLRDTPRVRDAVFRHELASSVQSIGIEPRLAFRPFGKLDVALGIRLAYVVSAHFTQTETLVEPDDYGQYLGAGRTWVNHDAEIPEATSLFVGLLPALRYTIPLNSTGSWLLQPEVAAIIPFTGVAASVDWKTTDLRFGIGISRAFVETAVADNITQPPPESPLAPIAPPILSTTPPTATLAVYAFEGGSTKPFDTVRIEETRIVDYLPVLPYVYFEQGSDVIPERFLRHKQTARANPESLTPDHAVISNLPVIAERLRMNPSARLTIVGCLSQPEVSGGQQLAERRVQAVRKALASLGVSADRLTTKTRKLPAMATGANNPTDATFANAENQRVELSTDAESILEPFVLGTVQRVVVPETLQVVGSAMAQGGIVQRVSNPVTEGTHTDTSWTFTTRIPSPTQPDSVSISIVDSLGRHAHNARAIPVTLMSVERKKTEQRDDAEVERYSLILFGFDDATVTDQHREVLGRIKNKISEGARVRILGMTDAMGSAEYNMSLSQRRAESVARMLGLPLDVVVAVGATSPRFDNSTPEGRAYNRTVIIELRGR